MSLYRFAKTSKAARVDSTKVVYPMQVLFADLAALLTESDPGEVVFCTNCRKIGEGAAAGTGTLVYDGGAAWLTVSTDAAPAV